MSAGELRHLAIAQVSPNPDQPRKRFETGPLEELADSIRSLGVVEPIVVQPTGPDAWTIIAGERRWRAATMAGLDTIPAIVREPMSDHDAFVVSMVENVLRRDMNPIEEAEGYQKLLDAGMTVDELATRLGKKASAIRSALTLLRLEPGIRELVQKGHLSAWDGSRLATLSWNGQARAFDAINRAGLTGNDRDRVIGQVWRDENAMPMFSEDDAPARSKRQADLRTRMERAMRELNAAVELLDGTMPDALTIELAEAANRAAGRIVKVTRQAKVVRVLEVAG
jgi:ParB family chromosome partitioning protein